MQRKTASTWVIVSLVVLVALALGLISMVMIGFDTGLVGFLLGFAMAALPVPFYVMFPLWLDRFEPEPWWLLALAFVWGAAISTFLALVFNTLNVTLLTAAAGEAGQSLGAVLSAPPVEEIAKGLALLLLFLWQRDEFDNVTDGIVYASMVGLGFAMTENVAYYGRAFAEGGAGSAGVLYIMRGFISPFAHPLFTSMTGIGLGAARESDKTWVKWFAPLAGLSAAILLHALWNLSAGFGLMFYAMYVVVAAPAGLAVLVIGVFSLRREAAVIRLHLKSIVNDGVLSSEDLTVLCSVTGRISASSNALFGEGFRAWRARRRFHRAATDFAFSAWRGSRGIGDETDDVRRWLLEALREARREAGLKPEVAAPSADLVRRLTSETPLPPAALTVAQKSLLCTAGVLAGQEFNIDPAGILIGRDAASAQLVVPEHEISKRHVWIGYRDGNLVAIDRGSTNGTFLNNERIQNTPLAEGDRLTLSGVVEFEVQ